MYEMDVAVLSELQFFAGYCTVWAKISNYGTRENDRQSHQGRQKLFVAIFQLFASPLTGTNGQFAPI